MNACTHLHAPACPRYPRKPSHGICARCPVYVDSGQPRVTLTVKATAKVQPVPREQWPLWASAISKLANEEDIGVGSTVDRLLGRFGVAYKATLKAMGVPCGCAKRKEEWDAGYGY